MVERDYGEHQLVIFISILNGENTNKVEPEAEADGKSRFSMTSSPLRRKGWRRLSETRSIEWKKNGM